MQYVIIEHLLNLFKNVLYIYINRETTNCCYSAAILQSLPTPSFVPLGALLWGVMRSEPECPDISTVYIIFLVTVSNHLCSTHFCIQMMSTLNCTKPRPHAKKKKKTLKKPIKYTENMH